MLLFQLMRSNEDLKLIGTVRMKKYFLATVEFLLILIKRFDEDRLAYAASALTFTTLLSLVPLMTVILGILSAFSAFHNVREQIQNFIFGNFVPASGQIVQKYLNTFVLQTQKLSVIGSIFLIVTGVLMIFTIERALNDIWHVEKRRSGLSAWLRYWAMLTLAPFFAALSIVGTSYLLSLPIIAGTTSWLGINRIVAESVPIILQLAGLTFLYTVIPNCYVRLSQGFIGAIIATIFFELAKKGFLIYITQFPTYQLLYGALATIPLFLIWVYVSWLIVLSGAVITNTLGTRFFNRHFYQVDGFFHAFLWLGGLWQAQQAGKGLSVTELQKQYPGHYRIPAETMLSILKHARLIAPTEKSRYVLMRDFSEVTLAELYHLLPWKLLVNQKTLTEHSALVHYYQQAQSAISKTLHVNLKAIYEDFFSEEKRARNA